MNSPVLGLGCNAQVRELLARAMHDANTGKICPDPDDPTRYGAMANAVMSEIAPLIGQYEDALRRLVALPHPGAIPRWWRPQDSHHEPITLTDVVDVLWQHVPPNSVGTPPPLGTDAR